MNRLANQQSPYLRHAARQKIGWYPWSDEAFEAASRENKPVFVSSGAVWCHWCHVMAEESFEDEETAHLLNRLFISVKLDRDERPDIDRRLQQAVAAMGSGTGWPLTVFLTPEREPFFGGTYFPVRDQLGKPGFKQVLTAVHDFYRKRKNEAARYAASIKGVLEPEALPEHDLSREMLDAAETNVLSLFDPVNGGFGTAPKFPMPGAVEFLLRRFSAGSQAAGTAARKTLASMVRGGFHDHLGGGFHRYSVDDAWIMPHFEKMTDDNAGLLKNYAEGYSVFGEEQFREAAAGIVRFMQEVLSDRAGGFYASQDADVSPEDEGGYFTWTEAELKEVLQPADYEIIRQHLLDHRGVMQGQPPKRVLAINRDIDDPADRTGKSLVSLSRNISRAKGALLRRRNMRTAPFVDKTLYTSLNGMMSAAYLRAFMALNDPLLREFALKTIDRILRENVVSGSLYHAPGVEGLLADYVHLIDALVVAFEATGDYHYAETGGKLMDACLAKFLDPAAGGFFDTEREVLGTRLKGIEDLPHPSPNGVAIMGLLKLAWITGKEGYRREAERALRIFSAPAQMINIHAGSFWCALDMVYRGSTLTVETAPDSNLAAAARALAVRSYSLVRYGPDNGRVIPCLHGACSEPITEPASLIRIFDYTLRPSKR